MANIGLTGTHRTGKTTLAKAWAEQEGVQYVTLSVTEVTKEMGMTTRQLRDDADARLELQQALVDRSRQRFFEPRAGFISDRTPIDVAAYTMADAVEGFYSDAQWDKVQTIVADCIDITNHAFHHLLMLVPEKSIGYETGEGKPAADLAYQLHHSLVIAGLLREEGVTVPVQRMRKGRALKVSERLAVLKYISEKLVHHHFRMDVENLRAAGHITTVQ